MIIIIIITITIIILKVTSSAIRQVRSESNITDVGKLDDLKT